MGKLFGTDGIRGVVNEGLDAELAYRVGQAAAIVLSQKKKEGRPLFTIGKDTRISSDMLEGALIAGLCTAGADVLHLGVIPTPAVAFLTIDAKADAGIVISASHNPYEYNGIKVFNSEGFKLSDELEDEIETLILSKGPLQHKKLGEIGRVFYGDQREAEAYINHLISTVDESVMKGLRILVDCANGASAATAAGLFDRFPDFHVDVINADPDGVNINTNCGSTHLEGLSSMVKAGNYDIGLAFDGDADRFLAVDEMGETIDGDQMLAICGAALLAQGKLPGSAIVGTVMSNIGLHIFAKEHGLSLPCTDVGDRNVLEKMVADGYVLGGEQSGHTIFLQYATTGDGQLSALQLLQVLCRSKKKASALADDCKRYPQQLLGVPVADGAAKKRIMESAALTAAIADEERLLGGDGRILVRPSGTEALIRVMVEGKDPDMALGCAQRLVQIVQTL